MNGTRISRTTPLLAAGLSIICIAGITVPARGELKGALAGWKATAEVSYVLTGGNSSTSAFSLGNTISRAWEKDSLFFKTYILRSYATTTVRSAVGTETDFDVVEEKTRRLAAENYLFSGQYDRRISKRFLGQAGLSWDRNRFSGIDSRFILTAGGGYAWVDTPNTKVKLHGGMTYTLRRFLSQEATSFAGFRLNLFLEQKLSGSATAASQFVIDDNLRKPEDWRYEWTNSLTASINKALAIKTNVRLLYANLPANASVPLFNPDGTPAGVNVLVPFKKLDRFFTTSLVINF